mgnify:CR=1 FL=1
MSTFAVFGMTETYAIKAAKRKVLKLPVAAADYDCNVNLLACEMMISEKLVQLSDAYDAPQFCKEFITHIKKSKIAYRDLRIRARVKNEEVGKKPKLSWIEYSEITQ